MRKLTTACHICKFVLIVFARRIALLRGASYEVRSGQKDGATGVNADHATLFFR
jgi:hypothetical protein